MTDRLLGLMLLPVALIAAPFFAVQSGLRGLWPDLAQRPRATPVAGAGFAYARSPLGLVPVAVSLLRRR